MVFTVAYKKYTSIDWESGVCRSIGGDDFFLDPGASRIVNPALRKICDACPIKVDCGDWALHHEQSGFWAGMNPAGLKRVRRERGIRYSELDYGLSNV